MSEEVKIKEEHVDYIENYSEVNIFRAEHTQEAEFDEMQDAISNFELESFEEIKDDDTENFDIVGEEDGIITVSAADENKSEDERHFINNFTRNVNCEELRESEPSFSSLCPKCGGLFNSYKMFQKHMDAGLCFRYENKHRCVMCPLSFCTNIELQLHTNLHRLNRFFCNRHCGHYFETLKECEMHEYNLHHSTNFKCYICAHKFRSLEALSSHQEIHNDFKRFICSFCREFYVCVDQLHKHWEQTPEKCGKLMQHIIGKAEPDTNFVRLKLKAPVRNNLQKDTKIKRRRVEELNHRTKQLLEQAASQVIDLDDSIEEPKIKTEPMDYADIDEQIKIASSTIKEEPVDTYEQTNPLCMLTETKNSSPFIESNDIKLEVKTEPIDNESELIYEETNAEELLGNIKYEPAFDENSVTDNDTQSNENPSLISINPTKNIKPVSITNNFTLETIPKFKILKNHEVPKTQPTSNGSISSERVRYPMYIPSRKTVASTLNAKSSQNSYALTNAKGRIALISPDQIKTMTTKNAKEPALSIDNTFKPIKIINGVATTSTPPKQIHFLKNSQTPTTTAVAAANSGNTKIVKLSPNARIIKLGPIKSENEAAKASSDAKPMILQLKTKSTLLPTNPVKVSIVPKLTNIRPVNAANSSATNMSNIVWPKVGATQTATPKIVTLPLNFFNQKNIQILQAHNVLMSGTPKNIDNLTKTIKQEVLETPIDTKEELSNHIVLEESPVHELTTKIHNSGEITHIDEDELKVLLADAAVKAQKHDRNLCLPRSVLEYINSMPQKREKIAEMLQQIKEAESAQAEIYSSTTTITEKFQKCFSFLPNTSNEKSFNSTSSEKSCDSIISAHSVSTLDNVQTKTEITDEDEDKSQSESSMPESLYLPVTTNCDPTLLNARREHPNYRFAWMCCTCPRQYEQKHAFRGHLVSVHGFCKDEFDKLIIEVRPFKCLKSRTDSSFDKKREERKTVVEKSVDQEEKKPNVDAAINVDAIKDQKNSRYRKHECNKCGRVCSSRTMLSDHIRGNCSREPQYPCTECPKKFFSASTLNCHMTIHTGELPHKCSFCDKRFRTRGQVTVHHRTHTGERPFVCQICSQGFTHRETLISHLSRHIGMKRYKCYACNKHFSCISGLRMHRDIRPDTCGLVKFNSRAVGPRVRVIRGNVLFEPQPEINPYLRTEDPADILNEIQNQNEVALNTVPMIANQHGIKF